MYIDKYSLACEAVNMADMVSHKDKLDLVLSLDNSFTRFLVHSRDALLKTMKGHGVDMKLFEMLWLHCVVHALDHHALADLVLGNRVVFGITDVWQDGSTFGRVHAFMFVREFVQEVLSPIPWLSNRLADLAARRSWLVRLSPKSVAFWRDSYLNLSALDAELAMHLTGSIMY